ncbi:hypothetical protein FSP39_014268 [Pinctada imbricata]|uniref:G-protein coupled receptors family 1 profile domain-containing protein n=1 Tax=Pinctada imbricata TaxID=66713 RepID=A0AA88XWR1_PINIB|nr:hypothetical protein FSP39_014268 [Pinctada imbricata]
MKVNSKSRTRKILAVTWIIPIIVCTPYLYCQSQAVTLGSEFGTISRQYCTDRFNELDNDTGLFRKCFFGLLFMIMYFVPMVVIIITCTRIAISLLKPIMDEQFPRGNRDNKRRSEMNKRKVARMVIVVAIAFIIAWSPQFIISMISQLQTESFLQESNFFFTMLIIHFFGFMNSCMNPFIYTAMSEKFRNSFRETLSRLFCYLCGRHTTRADYNGHSTTLMSNTTRTFQETEVEPLQHSGDGERLRVMYTTRKGSDVSYGSASYMNKHIPGEN